MATSKKAVKGKSAGRKAAAKPAKGNGDGKGRSTEVTAPEAGSPFKISMPDKIEHWPIDRLKPYPENTWTHKSTQVAKIAESMREYGWTQPILVDETDMILAGHGRRLAALLINEPHAPVIIKTGLSEAQKRAYRMADNRLTLDGEWDQEAVEREMRWLADQDFNLALTGFELDEIDMFMADEVRQDDPVAPEPPDEPTTRFGEIWVLGDHRLMCGKSEEPDALDALLAGAPIHLLNTDPPYNVKVEPRSNNAIAAGVTSFSRREDLQCMRSKSERGQKDRARLLKRKDGKAIAASDSRGMHHQGFDLAPHASKSKATGKMRAKDRPLDNDFLTDEEFAELLLAWFTNASRVLLPGRSFYIWGGYANIANYPSALQAAQLYFSQSIIWVKEHPVLTRKDFMGNHEWAFYGWREGAGHVWYGPNNATDVWMVKKVSPQSMIHLTEKPVELALRAIQYSSRPKENVLDLFGGSGSTLIGCENSGRHCYMMEQDPAYCDVIIERWQKLSGQKAVLEGDQTTFEEAADARAPVETAHGK